MESFDVGGTRNGGEILHDLVGRVQARPNMSSDVQPIICGVYNFVGLHLHR